MKLTFLLVLAALGFLSSGLIRPAAAVEALTPAAKLTLAAVSEGGGRYGFTGALIGAPPGSTIVVSGLDDEHLVIVPGIDNCYSFSAQVSGPVQITAYDPNG